jgi:hypothetical protein
VFLTVILSLETLSLARVPPHVQTTANTFYNLLYTGVVFLTVILSLETLSLARVSPHVQTTANTFYNLLGVGVYFTDILASYSLTKTCVFLLERFDFSDKAEVLHCYLKNK